MSRLRNLGIALEDNEEDQLPKEENQEAVSGELISDASEVSQDANETGDLINALEEMGDDLEDLEKVQDVAEGTLEEGTKEGMDPVTAQMTDIAVEAIRERLGFASKYQKVSLEAFGSKTSRIAATNISVEGIGEALKKGFEKVAAVIKAILAKVVDFFKRFISFDKNLKKAIEKLEAKAKELKAAGATAENKKLEIHMPMQMDTPKALRETITVHMDVSKAIHALDDDYKNFPDKINALITTASEARETYDSVVAKAAKISAEYLKPLASVCTISGKDRTASSEAFYDGSSMVVKDSGKLSFPTVMFSSAHEVAGVAGDVPVMELSDQLAILTQLKGLVGYNTLITNRGDEVMKFSKAISEGTQENINKAIAINEATKKLYSDILGLVRSAVTLFGSVNVHIPAKNAAFVRKSLEYISASQKEYKAA